MKKQIKIAEDSNVTDLHTRRKIGRDDPCPCGSGKIYEMYYGTKGKTEKCEELSVPYEGDEVFSFILEKAVL